MSTYQNIEVSEAELEDLVRRHCDKLEVGLRFVTHQIHTTDGRADVLLVDSGNSLVVAELKVVEDDQMLMQALDYYDYLVKNIEAFSRLLKEQSIDPTQKPRILLVAPSFSRRVVARVKWLSVPASLFRYQIIAIGGERIPVFIEEEPDDPPEPVGISSVEGHLGYIKNPDALARAKKALAELQAIDKSKVVTDAVQSTISFKCNGRVFTYLDTQRQRFILWTYKENAWAKFPISTDADLASVIELAKQKVQMLSK